MNDISLTQSIMDLFQLPERCLLQKPLRITKEKLYIESDNPAQAQSILEPVEKMAVIANLRPETVGIPAYSDKERIYEEILVVQVLLYYNEDSANMASKEQILPIAELLFKQLLHPMVVVFDLSMNGEGKGETGAIFAAPIRNHQIDKSKRVIEDVCGAWITTTSNRYSLPQSNLYSFYTGICRYIKWLNLREIYTNINYDERIDEAYRLFQELERQIQTLKTAMKRCDRDNDIAEVCKYSERLNDLKRIRKTLPTMTLEEMKGYAP